MADQRFAAAQGRVGGQLLDQSSLPDTRLADHHHQRALARSRGVEARPQLAQLVLAAHECPPVERTVGGSRGSGVGGWPSWPLARGP